MIPTLLSLALLALGIGAPVPHEVVRLGGHLGTSAAAAVHLEARSHPTRRVISTHASATRPATPRGRVSLAGQASWYCRPGVSACTAGFSSAGWYAAAGPAVRTALGDWRGRMVTVTSGGVNIRVRLIDWCACPRGRLLDLYASAFDELAPLSSGVVRVRVTP